MRPCLRILHHQPASTRCLGAAEILGFLPPQMVCRHGGRGWIRARFRHFPWPEEFDVSDEGRHRLRFWVAHAIPLVAVGRLFPPSPGHPLPTLVDMGWTTPDKLGRPSCSAPATAALRSSACSRPARPSTAPATSAIEMAGLSSRTRSASCPAPPICDGEFGLKENLYVRRAHRDRGRAGRAHRRDQADQGLNRRCFRQFGQRP